MSIWEYASIAAKFLIYPGIILPFGGLLCLWLYAHRSRDFSEALLVYAFCGATLGTLGTFMYLLFQVAAVSSGSGLAAMFDSSALGILMQTPLGDSTQMQWGHVMLLRFLGFLAAAVIPIIAHFHSTRRGRTPGDAYCRRLFLLTCIPLLFVVGSFRMVGHASVLGSIAQTAVAGHILALSLWIGCLFPLYLLCRAAPLDVLQQRMHRFGNHARFILIVLVVSGIVLFNEALRSPLDLLHTPYGNILLIKLLLTIGLLLIAAANRFRLVPHLPTTGPTPLQRAITLEMAVALLILVITATLSNTTPPTIFAPPAF